eukprot:7668909-Pyramimonas_sp.AAC.1
MREDEKEEEEEDPLIAHLVAHKSFEEQCCSIERFRNLEAKRFYDLIYPVQQSVSMANVGMTTGQ